MRHWIPVLIVVCVAPLIGAQEKECASETAKKECTGQEVAKKCGADEEGSKEALRVRFEEKLQAEFVKVLPWTRDLNQAQERAAAEGKPILAYFTRSDVPCPVSSRIESGPWITDGFVSRKDEFIPYLHIASGLEEKTECAEAERSDRERSPRVVFMDPMATKLFEISLASCRDGELVKTVGLALDDARRLTEARKRLEKRKSKTSLARVHMIEALRGVEHVDLAVLERELKYLKEDEDLCKRFATYQVVRPVALTQEKYEADLATAMKIAADNPDEMRGQMKAAQELAQAAIYKLFKAGQKLDDPDNCHFEFYWRNAAEAAIAQGDKRTAAIAHNELIKAMDKNPSLRGFLVGYRQRIEAM